MLHTLTVERKTIVTDKKGKKSTRSRNVVNKVPVDEGDIRVLEKLG